jgi:hypothetical protein
MLTGTPVRQLDWDGGVHFASAPDARHATHHVITVEHALQLEHLLHVAREWEMAIVVGGETAEDAIANLRVTLMNPTFRRPDPE